MAICLVFTAGIEFVNSFLHGGNQIDTMTLLIEIIGLISCALFSGLSVGTDFSGRTIIHTVTSGKSRSCVWVSKYLSFFMACIVLLSVNSLAANAGFLLFHRTGLVFSLTGMTAVVLYTFAGIVYDLCLASLLYYHDADQRKRHFDCSLHFVRRGYDIQFQCIVGRPDVSAS